MERGHQGHQSHQGHQGYPPHQARRDYQGHQGPQGHQSPYGHPPPAMHTLPPLNMHHHQHQHQHPQQHNGVPAWNQMQFPSSEYASFGEHLNGGGANSGGYYCNTPGHYTHSPGVGAPTLEYADPQDYFTTDGNGNANGDASASFAPLVEEYELFGRGDPDLYYRMAMEERYYVDSLHYRPPQETPPVHRSTAGATLGNKIDYQSVVPPLENHSPGEDRMGTYAPPAPESHPLGEDRIGTYSPFARNFLEVRPPNPEKKRETEASPAPPAPIDVVRAPISPKGGSDPILPAAQPAKKRIVAEVKPMRPSYSDILAKGPRGPAPSTPDVERKKRDFDFETAKSRNDRPKVAQERGLSDDRSRRETAPRNAPKTKIRSEDDAVEFSSKTTAFSKPARVETEADRKRNGSESSGGDGKPPGETERGAPVAELRARKTGFRREDRESDDEDHDRAGDSESTDGESDDARPSPPSEAEKARRRNREKYHGARLTSKNSERFKRKAQTKQKRNRNSTFASLLRSQSNRFALWTKRALLWFCRLILDIFQMSSQLMIDSYRSLSDDAISVSRSVYGYAKERLGDARWLSDFGNYVDSKFGPSKFAFWRRFATSKTKNKTDDGEKSRASKTNIPLPATREEAMKRLLERKGKDPYSILGVGVDCTDDDIKRYYRRQAFLVHPDKNQQPGAEEAFKILQHAFDLIGEPDRREAYDRGFLESQHAEAAWSELSELLTQLRDKVKHAAGTIRCTNCNRRHKKTLTDRPCYAARYCSQCKIHHSAKEGDIWAESRLWGIFWVYFACMDGGVYQIGHWAYCQKKNLKHLKANTHHVQYRIVSGNKNPPSNNSAKSHANGNPFNSNLEDFLSNMYSKTNLGGASGAGGMNSTGPNDAAKYKRKAKKKP